MPPSHSVAPIIEDSLSLSGVDENIIDNTGVDDSENVDSTQPDPPGVINGASPGGAPAPGNGTPPLPRASDLKIKPLTPLSEKAKITGYVMGHVVDSLGHLSEFAHQNNIHLLETSTGSFPAQTGLLAQDNQLTSSQAPHVPLEEVSRTACKDGVLPHKEEVVMSQTKHTHCGIWRLLITPQSQEA